MSNPINELAIQQNHSFPEMKLFIANLFSPTPVPIQLVQCNQIPTSSQQYELSSSINMLAICRRKYFQVLQQYELKNSGGVSTIKFILKDVLAKAMKDAEEQTIELWQSLQGPSDEHEWKQKEAHLRKFILDANSAVQIENERNRTLYVEGLRNQIIKQIKEFEQIFKIKYTSLCSSNGDPQPEPLENAKGKESFRKFYDNENLKRMVNCMASQVAKSCEQLTVKLNPSSEPDTTIEQLKVEVHNWGNNLVDRNHKYMTTIQEYVNTSIISKFVSKSESKLKMDRIREKRAIDFKSTQQRIKTKLKGLINPYLIEVGQIFSEFALDNFQQLLEHYNQILEEKMNELCEDAILRWRAHCDKQIKLHHDKMKVKISTTESKSTPQFVLDVYAKHLEAALDSAKIEVEENILGIGIEEEPVSPLVIYNHSDDENGETQNGPHASPIASTSSAVVRCSNDGHNGDNERNNKRRKS